jgi:hypothetical protein
MDSDLKQALAQLLAARTAPPGTEVNLPEELIVNIVRASQTRGTGDGTKNWGTWDGTILM